MNSRWWLCATVVTAACSFPALPALDGGSSSGDDASGGDSRPFGLELIAGGIGGPGNLDGIGPAARFFTPRSVAVDRAGAIFVADAANNRVRKIAPGGTVTTLAGTGKYGFADGMAAVARFANLQDIAVDGDGNVYVCDRDNVAIRKISTSGQVSTLAGMVGQAGSADGTGSAAQFFNPDSLAVDGAGIVYVADTVNSTIRKITPAGVVTTLAGAAGMRGSADGTGASARFQHPAGIAVDGAGTIYVADTDNNTIRKITPAGVVTTLAGQAGTSGFFDGTSADARFNQPGRLAVDPSGTIYVADVQNSTIRKITSAGVVTTFAGTAGMTGSVDGTGAVARFVRPGGVDVDGAGNVYVSDSGNHTIRMISPERVVTTLAGLAVAKGHEDGTGAAARFDGPLGVTADESGSIYVADTGNHTIRKVSLDGAVTTIAGSALSLGSVDATGATARFNGPFGVAVDGAGNLYVGDGGNSTIRKIAPGAVVTTLAGSPQMSNSVDGTGSDARFMSPQGVAVDRDGNVYVADFGATVIRKISPAAVATTLAGMPGMYGPDDGIGPAARFRLPSGVAVDGAGTVYVADTLNSTIRKVTAEGMVTTLAGAPQVLDSADGAGTAARFAMPAGIALDRSGNLYVADTQNSTIRKITPGGAVTTIAGAAADHGIVLGETPRLGAPRALAVVGDSLVIVDAGAVLLLRHGAR